MKLSELIATVGDDNVAFQNLDQSMIRFDYFASTGVKITFGTEQPFGLDGPKKLGLVVWLDREAVAAAVAKEKS